MFLVAVTLAPAAAQQAGQSKPAKPYGGGTPLDVIMHTKLWENVPPMRPFVRAARPPESTLHYIPTHGTEPKRPPLRTAAQVQQIEDQLENAGARNETVGGIRDRHFHKVAVPATPPAKTSVRKTRSGSRTNPVR